MIHLGVIFPHFSEVAFQGSTRLEGSQPLRRGHKVGNPKRQDKVAERPGSLVQYQDVVRDHTQIKELLFSSQDLADSVKATELEPLTYWDHFQVK